MKRYINIIKKLEEKLTCYLNGRLTNRTYKVLFIFTELGSSLGVAVIFVFIFLISGPAPLKIIVPVYLLQLLIVELTKAFFKRPRPQTFIQANKNLFGIRTSSGSFPSGHTSNSFCMAFLLSQYYNPVWFWVLGLFLTAVGVGISRIYLGKHYIIDVIVGAVMGILISVLTWNLIYLR